MDAGKTWRSAESAQGVQGVKAVPIPPAPAKLQTTGCGSDDETGLHIQICTPTRTSPGSFTAEEGLGSLGSQQHCPCGIFHPLSRQLVSWEACPGRQRCSLVSINPEEAESRPQR